MSEKLAAPCRPRLAGVQAIAASLAGLLIWMSAALLASHAPLQQQERPQVVIGVVLDGPWSENESIRAEFENAILQLLQSRWDVRLPEEKYLVGDWTGSSIQNALNRQLDDPEVDIVLASGVIASTLVATRSDLPKPVVAPWIVAADLLGVPSQVLETQQRGVTVREFVSGVHNLSYISISTDIAQELRAYLEIVPFEKISFVVNRVILTALPELRQNLHQAALDMELDYEIIEVEDSLVDALQGRVDQIEAAYLAPLLQLSAQENRRGIDYLIEHQIPTFSLWGRSAVEKGIMAALALDTDIGKLARRVALNIQRILLGEDPGKLPVGFKRRQRLTINMATAKAVGVFPSFALLTEAELIQDVRTQTARKLTLLSAVEEAVSANLDLAVSDRLVAAGRQEVRQARALYYPAVDAASLTTFIDDDRADASPTVGQAGINNSLTLTQILYSDSVRANVRINEEVQRGRVEEREQLRLDIVQEAATAYLNVLIAETVEEIRRKNLELTRANLELARVRQQLGHSGIADVLRWASQIANDRRDVIESSALRNQSEIQLNRLLNRPLEEPFVTRETALDNVELLTSQPRFFSYINNQEAFRHFRRFLVDEGLAASPELRRLDASIAAQQRALLAARRSFWSPDVTFQASLADVENSGSGASLFPFPQPGNIDWTLAFNVTLPLFEGGARTAEKLRTLEELEQLRTQRASTAQKIEQRIRSAAHQAGFSYAAIKLAEEAYLAANRNFELVQDSYRQGVVSIIDLLDAQNADLTADLARANAVYSFLIDWVEVERAVGEFDFLAPAAARQDFLNRVDEYFRQKGVRLRGR